MQLSTGLELHANASHDDPTWELSDQGTEAFTTYALEEAAKAAVIAKLIPETPAGAQLERFSTQAIQGQLGREIDPSCVG